jgi:hypothetical protein
MANALQRALASAKLAFRTTPVGLAIGGAKRAVNSKPVRKVADTFFGTEGVARATSDAIVSRMNQGEIAKRNALSQALDNQLRQRANQLRMQGDRQRAQKLLQLSGQGEVNLERDIIGRDLTTPRQAAASFGRLAGGVASMGVDAVPAGMRVLGVVAPKIAAAAKVSPLVKLATASGIRGIENAAFNAPVNAAEATSVRDFARRTGNDVLYGAGANAALSPKLLKGAATELVGKKAPGFAEVSGFKPGLPGGKSKVNPPNATTGEIRPPQTVNLSRLNISEKAKQEVANANEDIRAAISEKVGTPLRHEDVINAAQTISKSLNKVISKAETEQMGARALANRQNIARMAQSGKATPELLDALEADIAFAANAARLLGQRNISADPVSASLLEQYVRAVTKAGVSMDEVRTAAANVDFNNPTEAAKFYRQFVKPKVSDWIDALRYNSMLSSPLTHIKNVASNVMGVPIRAATKSVTGFVDFLGSKATGKAQQQFSSEGGAYLKGYLKNLKPAYENAIESMRSMAPSQLDDLNEATIPLALDGKAGKISAVLGIPTRFLEAADQFFMTLGRAGEEAALTQRAAKGGKVPASEAGKQKLINEGALYSVFRTKLGSDNQGTVLKAIDEIANKIGAARRSSNPIVAIPAKWTFPFLQTPTNIFKQGIEYSPLGFATIPGAANKQEQAAKAIMGSMVAGTAATLLASDRLTFGAPTSEKERQLWKEAGRQEYSVKVGDTWYAYNQLAPAIAFPLAMVAGVHDMVDKKKITDDEADMVIQAFSNVGKFLFDQSYMKSMGEFLKIGQGQGGAIERQASNYVQQLFPLRGFLSWIARAGDEFERQTSKDAGFWEQQIQLFMQSVPGLRGLTPTRLDSAGEPVRANNQQINAISPVRTSSIRPEADQNLELYQEQRDINRDANALREEAKNEALGEMQRQGTGVQAAEPGTVAKPGEPIEGVKKRGSSYAYTVDGVLKVTNDLEKANKDKAKDLVSSGVKDRIQIGDTVYAKADNEQGYRIVNLKEEKKKAETNQLTSKIELAKRADNFTEWRKYKEQQFNALNDKLKLMDTELDAADIETIQNQLGDILAEVAKYDSYKGFKKPSKGKKSKYRAKVAGVRSIARPAITKRTPTLKLKGVSIPRVGKVSVRGARAPRLGRV